MRHFALLVLFCSFLLTAEAQSVTYSEHIAPIIYQHCTNCHRPGEVAPFPLTNYTQVQANASTIKYATSIRYMPPWKADKNYQRYQHENFLTDAQIQQISDWVDQGTPQGNPALEPPLPVFPTGSQVGTPDMVVSFAQQYKHVGNNVDEYRYFVLPTNLTQDQDIVALEVRPGNKRVVHHTLIWQDTSGQAAAADAATPEYGYESGGNIAATINQQLPGYVPGQKPQVYTNGIGMKLFKGADLKLQMHYAPTATDEYDSTSINLFFAHQPVSRYVKSYVMLPLPTILTNGPFVMPPNQVKTFHGQYTVPLSVSMVGIAPHMHKLGQFWNIFAVKPTGDTVPLININEWDFNWQGTYSFQRLIPLPAGSVIHATARYDNTTANINNPHNPPVTVSWGEKTSDEMYYLPLLYLDYQAGDENVVFESPNGIANAGIKMVEDKLYPIAPNPAGGKVTIGFTLADAKRLSLQVFDASGKEVKTILNDQFCLPGRHTNDVDVTTWPAGVYSVTMQYGNQHQTQQLVVSH
ncbi:MAG: T9SS type A sorting domain-containing protein [Chitinophagales bacterium]